MRLHRVIKPGTQISTELCKNCQSTNILKNSHCFSLKFQNLQTPQNLKTNLLLLIQKAKSCRKRKGGSKTERKRENTLSVLLVFSNPRKILIQAEDNEFVYFLERLKELQHLSLTSALTRYMVFHAAVLYANTYKRAWLGPLDRLDSKLGSEPGNLASYST